MSLCEGTSGSFFCPNSLTRLNEIYCCGVSGFQYCCDHDTFSNVFTNLGGNIPDPKKIIEDGMAAFRDAIPETKKIIDDVMDGVSLCSYGPKPDSDQMVHVYSSYSGDFALSVGTIIGIAVGALILIIGLFVCCCWCCKCCCFSKRRQPGMVLVPASNPITIMNNAPPNQGYSRLVEDYGGELQPVAAPPPYVADYPADPHCRK